MASCSRRGGGEVGGVERLRPPHNAPAAPGPPRRCLCRSGRCSRGLRCGSRRLRSRALHRLRRLPRRHALPVPLLRRHACSCSARRLPVHLARLALRLHALEEGAGPGSWRCACRPGSEARGAAGVGGGTCSKVPPPPAHRPTRLCHRRQTLVRPEANEGRPCGRRLGGPRVQPQEREACVRQGGGDATR